MTIYTTGQTRLYRQVVADLILDEGYKRFAYADPLSQLYKQLRNKSQWGMKPARELFPAGTDWTKGSPWTVGIGYTKGVTVDSTMEQKQAEKITEGHVAELDGALHKAIPWYAEASFVTKTVLINMAYNMGLNGLLQFRNTLAYMGTKEWNKAARNMERSLWYKQVGSRARRMVARIETQTIAPEHLV